MVAEPGPARPAGRAREAAYRPSPAHRLLAHAWSGWEWLFARLYRLYEVPGTEGSALRFGFRRWPGPGVTLQDGTAVRPGDWVAEVHINSPRVMDRWAEAGGSTLRVVAALSSEMRSVLRGLAREIEAGRVSVPVKALYGKTLLHRAAGRLGFEVHDLPDDRSARFLAAYERWLSFLYAAGGRDRLTSAEPLKIIWLSVPELLRRFGGDDTPGAARPSQGGTLSPGRP
ncbi:MAG: hypothetical protein AB1609_14085 [Bacillota bacterium]